MPSYVDNTAVNGTQYFYVVSSTNACGESAGNSIESHGTPEPPVPVNSVLPAITGTAQVGFTLTGSNGTWTNAPTGYTYRWLANGVAIGGATAATFLLTSAQLGEVITFEVTAANGGGSGTPSTSAATSAVLPAVPVNSVLPAITGTATVGQTLSGSNGTWSNSPTGYTYRWLANSVAIGGATANTFTLTDTQVGAVITFEVTASNTGGSGSPATSAATSAVLALVPVNSVLPAITGTPMLSLTLTGSNGTWTHSPTGYTYRWLSNGVAIGGATSNTLVLAAAQRGTTVTFEVTASNSGGSGSAATSAGVTVDNSLVGWWMLNEGSGTAIADSSGHGHPATMNGATWVTGSTGSAGSALKFTGVITSNVTVNSVSADLQFGGTLLSTCGWIKYDALNDGWCWGQRNTGAFTNDNWDVYCSLSPSHGPYFEIFNSTNAYVYQCTTALVINTWYHIAYVRNGTDLAVYINGSLIVNLTVTALPFNTASQATSIGGCPATAVAASIDDVRLYNRALTSAEIAAIWALG